MVKNILSAVVASTVLMSANFASAESYVGVSFGSSDYETTSTISTTAAAIGVNSLSEDTKDSGFQFYYGYKVTPEFALEVSYTDFGETVASGSGTFSGVAIDLDVKQELSALGVAAVYQFNQSGTFKPYVKLGLNRLDLDVSATVAATSGAASSTVSTSDSGTDFSYGLGFDVAVSDAFAIRAGYEMFKIDSEAIDDVSLLSLGLKYQF